MEHYVITIARGFGSGGKDIGNRLAQRLGIPCYESQILKMASDESGINEALFAQVDEKLKGLNKIRRYLREMPPDTVVEPRTRKFTSDANLFNIQSQIIRHLARTESCIIIGKCADYVLRKHENVISVYIEAPRKDCLESIMEKMGVTAEEASGLIEKTDRFRADYYKYYTNGRDWTNPINYDMTLNSARISREKCVELLESYVKIKGFQR